MKPVCIVNTPQTAKILSNIMQPNYVVCSFPNPADLQDFTNRNILLWPDNTDESKAKFHKLAAQLPTKEIKLISLNQVTPNSTPEQIISPNWTWNDLFKWAKLRAYPYKPADLAPTESAGPSTEVEILPPEHISEPVPVDEYALDPDIEQGGDACALATWEDMGLFMSKKNAPYLNSANVNLILCSKSFHGKIWYDLFAQKIMTSINPMWSNLMKDSGSYQREWTDADDSELLNRIQVSLGLHSMTKGAIQEGVKLYARRNSRDDVVDWIDTLQWDEFPRIETFFSDAFGAENTPYTRAASKNMWISLAARIMDPGCKVDNMVILEGKQGIRKSSALDVIGGKYFSENNEALDSKDFDISLRGTLIVEFAELDFFKKADVDLLKRKVSQRIDRYRPPYGINQEAFPRRCIFIGTTNKDEYLHDETGARRFWPIKCHKINLEYIKDNREQLYAEAQSHFLGGETWWEMPELETKAIQALRSDSDPRKPEIIKWLSQLTATRFSMFELMNYLGIPRERMGNKGEQIQLGKILSQLKCEKRRTSSANLYLVPENIQQLADELDREIYGHTEPSDDKEKPLRSESEGLDFTVPEQIPF